MDTTTILSRPRRAFRSAALLALALFSSGLTACHYHGRGCSPCGARWFFARAALSCFRCSVDEPPPPPPSLRDILPDSASDADAEAGLLPLARCGGVV